MRKITPRRLLIVVTAATAVALLLVATGALDRLAGDRSVSSRAVWSLITWWAVFCAVTLLVTACVRRPREMALAAGTVLLMLVGTEVVLRPFDIDRTKPEFKGLKSSRYHHVYPANAEMLMGTVQGRSVTARTNEDGLRTDMTLETFLRYKNRVVLLGDSFTLGVGVAQDRIVSSVLERELRERMGGEDVAVLNAGVVSYSPLLERQQYRGIVRRYRPTLVLLMLDASDIGDDIRYAREVVPGEAPLHFDFPDQSAPRVHLAVYELARPVLGEIGRNLRYLYVQIVHGGSVEYDYYDFEVTVGGQVDRNRFFIYRHPLAQTRPFFETTLALIADIAADVEADGAAFLLVVLPRYHMWGGRECPDNWEIAQGAYTTDDPHQFEFVRFFAEAGEGAGLDVFNLLPSFEATDRFPLVFPNDPHWNENGHAFVAEELSAYLLERELI
ncbi:MAG: hypothetical protein OEO21_12005, partial [Candidatus Krumholzibacteria bacterium]|nr:hypothetical protein [Candidatus Krumholzibacteria bacterium]